MHEGPHAQEDRADGAGHGRAPQAGGAGSTGMVAVDLPGGSEAGQHGTRQGMAWEGN